MNKYFFEIEPAEIREKYILLDVDGTIAVDHNEVVIEEALDMIKQLEIHNQIVLLSNNRRRGRIRRISKATSLEYLKTKYKKPNAKILRDIEKDQRRKILVIGDKVLTDVIFAKRIKSPYIKVKRVESRSDRWFVKVFYLFDDLIYFVIRKFF